VEWNREGESRKKRMERIGGKRVNREWRIDGREDERLIDMVFLLGLAETVEVAIPEGQEVGNLVVLEERWTDGL
jgi:hypothetical protein